MKKSHLMAFGIAIVALLGVIAFVNTRGGGNVAAVTSYDQCEGVGEVIDGSCITKDGKTFVQGMADGSFELRGSLERKGKEWRVRAEVEGAQDAVHGLVFTDESICLSDGMERVCADTEFVEGSSVFVKGRENGKDVAVDVLLVL
jgi:hypothetical protein